MEDVKSEIEKAKEDMMCCGAIGGRL